MSNNNLGLSSLDLLAVMPEIFLGIMVIAILLFESFSKKTTHKSIYALSIVALIGATILTIVQYNIIELDGAKETLAGIFGGVKEVKEYFWYGEIAHSKLISVFKFSMLLIVLVGLFYSYPRMEDENLAHPEFYILTLLSMVGMLVLVSAASILTIYLGLELMSLPMYALVAFNRKSKKATEAAMKYFVMGAMASGILLFGMALLYGATGTLHLNEMGTEIIRILGPTTDATGVDRLLLFSIVFIVVGVVFKLGAAPFHAWVPDVYEGAPIPVAMFVGAAPKIAALVMGGSLLYDATYNYAQGDIASDWQTLLAIVAIISFVVGNVVALRQNNLRRMLGYSAVSHAGFIILGLFIGDGEGYRSGSFYAISYALTTVAAFGFILSLKNNDKSINNIDELRGLYRTHPLYALLMTCIMLSMAGIPTFVGFQAKWYVLKGAFESGFVVTVIIGLVTSIIGLAYYLRVVKTMFFDGLVGDNNVELKTSLFNQILFIVNVLILVVLGIRPSLLLGFL